MTFIDTIDAVIVGAFLASYVKYPPIGRDGEGDPHCVDCGATTLEVDDEIDMVAYHVFRCRECQQARLDRRATDDKPAPPPERPDDEWDPNAPASATNHPPCQACELGAEGALCTCGDWESTGDPAPPPVTA